jgi:hypothetical protein
MELLLTSLVTSYLAFLVYVFERLRRFKRIPIEQRKNMTFTQRLLALYGFSSSPSHKDIQNKAVDALTNFHNAWDNMQEVFKQFEGTFDLRRQELQKAEGSLANLENEIKEKNEKLRAQKELTPAAAREVEILVEKSNKSALRQQIVISTVFFLLGCGVTLTITLLTT